MKKAHLIVIVSLCLIVAVCSIIIYNNAQIASHNHEAEELIPISAEEAEKISATRKIVIEEASTQIVKKTITAQNEVKTIIDMFSRAYGITEPTFSIYIPNDWNFALYGIDGELIYVVEYWVDNKITIRRNHIGYHLAQEDSDALLKIINVPQDSSESTTQ